MKTASLSVLVVTIIGFSLNLFCAEDTQAVSRSVASIAFYDEQAQVFYDRVKAPSKNLASYYAKFLPLLSPGSRILDLGCGIGRDSQYFESLGHCVTAIDGSKEMVRFANAILKVPARVMLFSEVDFEGEFDAVWAAASLIHIPRDELGDILDRVYRALKPGGIFFLNFKHGTGEYTDPVEKRTFYYMTRDPIQTYLTEGFDIIEIWTTEDFSSCVAHSPDKMWLNILARKKE